MSERELVLHPDKKLRLESSKIKNINGQVISLIDDMIETMHKAAGIGLAAIQVGIPKQLLVIDIAGEDEEPNPMVMINPQIQLFSDEVCEMREGCLSIPEMYEEVTRPEKVQVEYLDREGNSHKIDADGLLSRVIQHEVDHLNGKLFIDHLSRLKKDMLLRKYKKLQNQQS